MWAGVDDCDADMTALIWAAHNGHTEVLMELLQKGVDTNAADNDGEWREASRAVGAQDGGMFEGRGAQVFL